MAPYLAEPFQSFYQQRYNAEKRHYHFYIDLAYQYYQAEEIEKRVGIFSELEDQLIYSSDQQLRFHSGILSGYLT